jgi:hypothetical protein
MTERLELGYFPAVLVPEQTATRNNAGTIRMCRQPDKRPR